MTVEMTKLVNRFKDYISYNTISDDASETCPSTPGQMVLAKHIVEELKALGLADAQVDANGYVMATLPANGCENAPVVGFVAHMDTSPDMAGGPLNPRIVENYDGEDIVLNTEHDIVLSIASFPEIKKYIGQDIMVTDGMTLLGADDKAGVCEIVSAVEYLLAHPEIKHGKVRIGFTPDEEIGRGADRFDVEAFGADFAYTMDGGEIGGLEYENFNAANAVITIQGRGGHTGSGKNKMINALRVAAEWQMMLPQGQCPECTEGYEGFYHVHKLNGNIDAATMTMLLRDHDRQRIEERKAFLHNMAALLNAKYGAGTVTVNVKDSYYNMREKIEDKMYIIELAQAAMREVGVEPVISPIRGGTDGARLSFMGLPCPNIFTGGHNYHGRYEYLPLLSMQKASDVVLEIIKGATKL